MPSNTEATVEITVQNNSGVEQTITDIKPFASPSTLFSAALLLNNCAVLQANETCSAVINLKGLKTLGEGKFDVSVCSFNGTLCSGISVPLTVAIKKLVSIAIEPINSSIAITEKQQFYATGFYSDGSSLDM